MPSKNLGFRSYVSPEEMADIRVKAEKTGLSVSTFAKRLCLGYDVPSLEHQQARREILNVNADLGRLGGLIKQALANGADRHMVHRILNEIDARQRELKTAVSKIR